MTTRGVVKSFSSLKGWGFIDVNGLDVFVHSKDCVGGLPAKGDVVFFDAEPNTHKPGQMQAKNVTGGSGSRDAPDSSTATSSGPIIGRMQGTLKSWNAEKGFGFASLPGSGDVFVHTVDCIGGQPVVGDVLTFDVEQKSDSINNLKARNITGGSAPLGAKSGNYGPTASMSSNTPSPYGQAGCTGAGIGCTGGCSNNGMYGTASSCGSSSYSVMGGAGDSNRMYGSTGCGGCDMSSQYAPMGSCNMGASQMSGQHPQPAGDIQTMAVMQGMHGVGTHQPTHAMPAPDTQSLQAMGCMGMQAADLQSMQGTMGMQSVHSVGSMHSYPGVADLQALQELSTIQALHSISALQGMQAMPGIPGKVQGILKAWNVEKGFGFASVPGSGDVFVHVADCIGGQPAVGDILSFDVEPSNKKDGSINLKAKNVTGGTAPFKLTGAGGATSTASGSPDLNMMQAMGYGMAGGKVQGTLKTWNSEKGFGFVSVSGSPDIFLHAADCIGGQPLVGDLLTFDVEPSQKKDGSSNLKARNVTGGSGPSTRS